MKRKEYVKKLLRQAKSFRALSKLLRTEETDSKQLIDAAVAEGLAEVCEGLAHQTEPEG